MNAMPEALIRGPGRSFDSGVTPLIAAGRGPIDVGFDFGIHVQPEGDVHEETTGQEVAWVLLDGAATVTCGGTQHDLERRSLFDAAPAVVHAAAGTQLHVAARSARVEWAVARVANPAAFAPRVFLPDQVEIERRGAELAQGACARTVRLVFDARTRPVSALVVGEVVTDAGRWSSYPPHAHPQPELYHYRFTPETGYGHGECGDAVYRIASGDTLCIPGGATHAQVAAAGYGMYYLWIVRHLPGSPYTGFEYDPRHAWLLDPAQQGWKPL
jgi:5-deoxy-glucuronate isomerase